MMFQCSSPFTSSFPPRFWKDVLISIGYTEKWRRQTKTDERRPREPLLLTIIPIGSARIVPFVVLCMNRSISIFVHRSRFIVFIERGKEKETSIFENDEMR
jgi:hypothetical protein